jgi:iron-sulfur cluster assembly protein
MGIALTPSAVEYVKNFLVKRGKGEGLRVGVKKSGCSGFAYVLDFADAVNTDDVVYEQDGVKVIVAADSLSYLDGMEVDYVKEGLNSFFKFNNPNVKDSCGCGESFSV